MYRIIYLYIIILLVPFKVYGIEDEFRKAIELALIDMADNMPEYIRDETDLIGMENDSRIFPWLKDELIGKKQHEIHINTFNLPFPDIDLEYAGIVSKTFNLGFVNAIPDEILHEMSDHILMYTPFFNLERNKLKLTINVYAVTELPANNTIYPLIYSRIYIYEYDCGKNSWYFKESYGMTDFL